MKRKILGHQVADQLFAAEAAIDNALSAVATLTAMLPNARIEARLNDLHRHRFRLVINGGPVLRVGVGHNRHHHLYGVA